MRDHPADAREPYGFALTSSPQEGTDLPLSPSGNNGIRGNHDGEFDPDDPVVIRRLAKRLRREAEDAWEHQDALAELREAEYLAGVAFRRERRVEDSFERHRERERRRAAGGLFAGQQRSPNRPTHVEVADDAWRVVKAAALEAQLTVSEAVGRLVAAAAESGVPAEPAVFGSPGSAEGVRERLAGRRAARFARLFVDDDTWGRFRGTAVDAAVSTARAVGLVVEAEARRLGWSQPDGQPSDAGGHR